MGKRIPKKLARKLAQRAQELERKKIRRTEPTVTGEDSDAWMKRFAQPLKDADSD